MSTPSTPSTPSTTNRAAGGVVAAAYVKYHQPVSVGVSSAERAAAAAAESAAAYAKYHQPVSARVPSAERAAPANGATPSNGGSTGGKHRLMTPAMVSADGDESQGLRGFLKRAFGRREI